MAFLVMLLVTGNTGKRGWRRHGRYAKSNLQKTATLFQGTPHNVYQSTHTYILLAAMIFLKGSLG
jgi:hypothetical protein